MNRRAFLRGVAGATAAAGMGSGRLPALAPAADRRIIPSTGESVPAVGLGTWRTFNVGDDRVLRDQCAAVMAAFFESGGGVIDSSPMYGSSPAVVGYGLQALGHPDALFSADKVWTSDDDGRPQIEASRRDWTVPRFDLLQVHNLVNWEEHLDTLFAMKAAGSVRYVGVTTSHGRRHRTLEEVMRSHPIDFVQLTYNVDDREADERLLPLASDRGIAVVVNRPFQGGRLIRRLEGEPLPPWAPEIGASSWPGFLLQFILGHPSVTVAIPATTRVDHVVENKRAATSPAPDERTRARMVSYVRAL